MSLPYPFDPRGTVPAVLSVTNIAALRVLSAGAAGMVGVAGTTTINDGGGGLFFWDAASVLADDGSSVVQPSGWSGAGRWRRTIATSGSLAGDVTGAIGANTVAALGGVFLPGSKPSARQLLMAASPNQLTYSALSSSDIPGINGVAAPAGAPTTGQVYVASDSTHLAWQTYAGDVTGKPQASVVSGIGTNLSSVPIHCSGLAFDTGLTPAVSQTAMSTTSGAPTNGAAMSVAAQDGQVTTNPGGTNATGGALTVKSGAAGTGATGTGLHGDVLLKNGTVTSLQLTGSIISTQWVPEIRAFATVNFDSSITGSQVAIGQRTVSGTGTATGVDMSVTAQAGQQQTGGSNNNNGGYLLLSGGPAGTGGAGTAGTAGGVRLRAGGSDRLVASATGVKSSVGFAHTRTNPTYGTTVTIDASTGNYFQIVVTNGTGWALAAPTNPTDGQVICIEAKNTSGGAMGIVTFNGVFKRSAGSSFLATTPANGARALAWFVYNSADNQWIQIGTETHDVPN